ncbi:MAG TPA: dihydropyrimidinase [Anaerolineae bacterium]|nr:dihydropyrimidinase [Anaerolineae bacterium]HID85458.1 dihydropyrimidinase [Anaerolineales bacterium]HIQ08161.1 dihydropyrimidinase [Anaerolineaceae bacterium]
MSERKLLFRGGTVVTAAESFQADVLVVGERIAAIGHDLTLPDAEVVDVRGKLLLPGGIDPHTHFDLPMFGTVSSDDHYTGTKAAAFGGTTTVMDFIPQDWPTLAEGLRIWQEKAAKAAVDYSFHFNLTRWDKRVAAELPQLTAWGFPSIKMFMAYNGRLRLSDGEIFQAMRLAARHGILTMLHAENGDVIDVLVREALNAGHTEPIWHARTRPAWGAVEAVLRGAALAAQAQAPLYVVHMNTAGGVDVLTYAKEQGVPIYGETCPQYLFFTEEHLQRPDGAKWICSPPMRTAEDNAALWEGLSQGLLDTVGTDHCPFFYDGTRPIVYEGEEIAIPGKELGRDDFTKIPNGLPGVGDRLPVLWTKGVVEGRLTPEQFVALTSTNAARIFGLYPRKGTLAPGADADIVVWDPDLKVTYGVAVAQHRTDYNLYEGWELTGFPVQVYLRGQLIVREGEWLGQRGQGRLLRRKPQAWR